MRRKTVLAVSCVLLLAPAWSALGALDPSLVVYWPFDEGQGTVAHDLSGHGNNGTLTNGPTWVAGKLGGALQFDGVNDYVTGPHIKLDNQSFTIAMWINPVLDGATQVVFGEHQSGSANLSIHFRIGGPGGTGPSPGNIRMGFYSNDLNTTTAPIKDNTWYHLTFWYDLAAQTQKIYVNGAQIAVRTGAAPFLGTTGAMNVGTWRSGTDQYTGIIDDVQVYHRALSDSEIQSIMKGLTDKSLAENISPTEGATDVPQDTTLRWKAGQYAATHDVYVGTTVADVNSASRTDAKGVLASRGQAETTFAPAAPFGYGQTYYWRIDEVNGTPDNTIFKGNVWTFTVEPYGYPVKPVAATASSSQASMGPENTINGSGLDKSDLHGTEPSTMWMSTGVKPDWIQYEFDKVYKLHQLLVWNSNQLIEGFLGFGVKKVTVETSVDGATWTPLAEVPEFSKAPGAPAYAANTTVNLGGVEAKFVKLTINANWGGMAPTAGLAEVRFSYIPVQARAPEPVTAAKGVSVDTDLNWRPGREANSHKVYLGTDPNAVINGTVAAQTVTTHNLTPEALNLGTTYYWRVDEVNTVTHPGEVWSFTTQDYRVVDDFESYTDKAGEEVFSTWIDGYVDKSSGSTVGLTTSKNGTYCETAIFRGGKQSMPLAYDNTLAPFYSEATRTFGTPQDWTANGIKSLSLWFQGVAGNGGQLYVKINTSKIVYDGDAADLARAAWQTWNIDLSKAGKLTSVRSLTIGIEGTGAKGTLYLDDVRLYPRTPEYITPVQPQATGLAAYYTFDEGSGTIAKDTSGNGNNGTVNGNPQWVAGKIGGALSFDGTGDFVDCGKGDSLVIRDTITISCWIKIASFTRNWETILGMGDDSYRMSRSATTGNSIHFGCNGPTGGNLNANTVVTTDTWRHVALVYDGANKIIYIDGIEDARVASAGQINVSAYKLYIGANSQQAGRDLKGVVDDVRIYSRPLSAGEVAGLAGLTKTLAKPF